MPRAVDALKAMAEEHGVCTRPVLLRRTDLTTGQTELLDLPCGATREDKCPPCAKRARRLSQQQCREGWHRSDEPLPDPDEPDEGQWALIRLRAHFVFERNRAEQAAEWDQVAELEDAIGEVDEAIAASGMRGNLASATRGDRLRRSARQALHQAAPGYARPAPAQGRLRPRSAAPSTARTGQGVPAAPTFLTLTLGHLRAGATTTALGTPVNPAEYDYRRAAWDAVHFPALLDRFWQNLRRACGRNVQYFGCVEPQRRLAPHAHFAMRGTIPRELLRRVAAATYHQVWWPPVDVVHYADHHLPVWDGDAYSTRTPARRCPPGTRPSTMDDEPVHVARFGPQLHAEGVLAGTPQADRLIGYLTKYLTKSVDACHQATSDRQTPTSNGSGTNCATRPCSPRCANWLRYGVQPKNAKAGQCPGRCKARVHQRATLGLGGRRVLVSRAVVRQNPRRPQVRHPRVGPRAARHHRRRRGRRKPVRLGDGPQRRPRRTAPATPTPTQHLGPHPTTRTGQRRAGTCGTNQR